MSDEPYRRMKAEKERMLELNREQRAGRTPEQLFRGMDHKRIRWICDQYDIPCPPEPGTISAEERSRILGALRGLLGSIPLRQRVLEDMIWAHNNSPGTRPVEKF